MTHNSVGLTLLAGGLIAQKFKRKIKATLTKREHLHDPAFMYFPVPIQ